MANPEIPVAVLGATGSVGQRFVQLLQNHPWFKVVALTGSDAKAGRLYGEACHWVLPQPMPSWAASMPLTRSDPKNMDVRLVFSAMPAEVAKNLEPAFARAGVGVFSNASAFRGEPDVPILLPEVNPGHIEVLEEQRRRRGWSGFIVTNPNCTSTGLSVVLTGLHRTFGVRRVFAVSMQAVSGAGYPGVSSLDIIDNVIPFIAGEEEKVESEPRKILGEVREKGIEPANILISVQANRVAVADGHLVCVSVDLDEWKGVDAAVLALVGYSPPMVSQGLPSEPDPVIFVHDQPDRPQPRLDRLMGAGMTTVVGRLREDPLFHLRMVVLSHNTIRGAAGGSIYNAELLWREGWLTSSY
jgi:aspartate-semialdehyde dehydrogenase